MAEPLQSATTLLTTISDAVRQVYHEDFEDMYFRFGRNFTKLFQPSKRRVDGDGINIQVRSHNLHGARVNRDIHSEFPKPRSFGADTYKVNLSETPADNDFRAVNMSLQVTHLDLKRMASKKVSASDFVTELVEQSVKNITETLALHRQLDSTARLAQINGTPKSNDRETYADAAAIGTTGGARVQIDNGTVAMLPAGLILDSYTGNTQDTPELYVSDYNPADTSVGLLGLDSDGDPSESVNINHLADNDGFYISGEKDQNILSVGHWFSAVAEGEDFFGKDRSDPFDRWLKIHFSGPSSNALFVQEHLDNLCIEMSFIQENPDGGYAVVTTPNLDQRFRNIVGNDVVIQAPTSAQMGKFIANMGFDGMMYRHPAMGRLVFTPEQFAPPNKIRFLRIGDWEMLSPFERFDWLDGDRADGWYRMPSSTPGNGNTKVYRKDGYMALCDICLQPRLQAQIGNVTHS